VLEFAPRLGGLLCGSDPLCEAWPPFLFQEKEATYLLYLDESGTHGGSPVFILAGIAVHERDAWHLQNSLDGVLTRKLPAGFNPQDFELHAADIKSPRRATLKRKASEWGPIPVADRLAILTETYAALARYRSLDSAHPLALFGAVIDKRYADFEERAYEEVLHKFDELMTRQGNASGRHEAGIVIHDQALLERRIQMRADRWRHLPGRIGTLTHLADVPLFADSRASRLIQGSDFVTWALWRYYGPATSDESRIRQLWDRFDADRGVMHGLIHVSRNFRTCKCPPCVSRR
jgi:hypothetical protein